MELTQRDIARATGRNDSTISRIVRSDTTFPAPFGKMYLEDEVRAWVREHRPTWRWRHGEE